MRSVRALIGLVSLAATTALGCTLFFGPDNTLVPGNEGAPGVKRFLVCAPNTVIALPAELVAVTRPLRDQIDAYLRFQGREAQWIDLYESRRLWGQAMTAAKAQGALEKTPAFFAKELDELYDFDAIVMPSVVLHKATGTGGTARWDGVERHMRVLNAPRRDPGTMTIEFGGLDGDLMVTSVHVLVFSRGGERVFEGRGGIELIHEIDLAAFKKKKNLDVRVREDLGRDVDALREGIAIAFDPYLPPPEE
jgi:hypothetical protein